MRTLLEALMYDQFVVDPPNEYHPTAWMGSAIGRLKKEAPEGNDQSRLGYGGVIVLGGAAVVYVLGQFVQRITRSLPMGLGYSIDGWLLKTTFSFGGLLGAADEVKQALEAGDLTEARRLVSWHLVSRDTSNLTASQVSAATIESVAENLSDGVFAPLFYYALGGLPLALAYRWVNTCDSMLGYRDAEHEWLGKIPAQFDDLVNLVPARLTAQALLLAGDNLFEPELARDPADLPAGAVYERDAATTDSPNAGHPMSAAAGVLGVELEKVDHYNLGAGQRKPEINDIGRMIELAQAAMMLVTAGLFVFKAIVWGYKSVMSFRRRFCE